MKNRSIAYALAISTAFIWSGSESFAQTETGHQRYKLPTRSKKTDSKTEFIRMTTDSAGSPKSLETSITRYRAPDKSLLIDLIAVIHVGEKQYYRKLDRQFTQYESMLYELVAPEHSRVPSKAERSEAGMNPLRLLQGSMQKMLGLHSQLEHIDYTKSNFVHADLSPAQMKRKLQERGQTPWSLAMNAFSEAMKNKEAMSSNSLAQEITNFDDLFSVMSDSRKLKRLLAKQFTSGGALEAGLGESLNKLLIDDRNEAAMKVLKTEIDKGKTKIAIFYGAAHMPDFEKRLAKELGMRKSRQAWVEAWDLQTSSPASESPVSSLTDMFFQLLNDAGK